MRHIPTSARLVFYAALAIGMAKLPTSNTHADDPSGEWDQRDVWRLRFEGETGFTADQLRRALALDAAVIETSRPSVPHEQFLQTVRARLLDGYRHEGYVSAEVIVVENPESGSDPDNDYAIDDDRSADAPTSGCIRITAGPKYKNGAIHLKGTPDDFDGDALIKRLSTLQLSTAPKQRRNGDDGIDLADNSLHALSGWESGAAAGISKEILEQHRLNVRKALEDAGFWFTTASVDLVPNHSDRVVDLMVQLNEPIERQPVGQIVFSGLSRHTDQQLRQFLNPEGAESESGYFATAAFAEDIRHRLLESGRFVFVKTHYDAAFGADMPVDLHVQVYELPTVPPVSEDLPAEKQAMLKLAERIRDQSEAAEDLQIRLVWSKSPAQTTQHPMTAKSDESDTQPESSNDASTEEASISGPQSTAKPTAVARLFAGEISTQRDFAGIRQVSAELSLSRRLGGILNLSAVDDAGENVEEVSVLMTTRATGIVNHKTCRQWITEGLGAALLTTVKIEGHPLDDNGHRFRLNLGFAVNNKLPLPIQSLIEVNPAGLLDFGNAAEGHIQNREDGSRFLNLEKGGIEFDSETGLVRRIQFGELGNFRIESGLVQQQLTELQLKTESWPNLYDPEHAFSSFSAFVGDTLSHSWVGGKETGEVWKIILRVLNNEAVMEQLAFSLAQYFSDDHFSIPADPDFSRIRARSPSGSENKPLSVLKVIVPVGTIPYRLSDALLTLQTRHDSLPLQMLIAEVLRDDRHGPLACLAVARLIPELRHRSAELGLTRINPNELPEEVQSLIHRPCLVGSLLKGCVQVIKDLSDDETTLLQTVLQQKLSISDNSTNPATPAWINTAMTLVRGHSSDDPEMILESVWLSFWQTFGHAMVRQRLTELLEESPPQKSVIRPASRSMEASQPPTSKKESPSERYKRLLRPVELPDAEDPAFERSTKILTP